MWEIHCANKVFLPSWYCLCILYMSTWEGLFVRNKEHTCVHSVVAKKNAQDNKFYKINRSGSKKCGSGQYKKRKWGKGNATTSIPTMDYSKGFSCKICKKLLDILWELLMVRMTIGVGLNKIHFLIKFCKLNIQKSK